MRQCEGKRWHLGAGDAVVHDVDERPVVGGVPER